MAGVSLPRLRLTTSRKPSYRRGGVKIGTANAPTIVELEELEFEPAVAILGDPHITIAVAGENDEPEVLLGQNDRAALIAEKAAQWEALGTEEGLNPAPVPLQAPTPQTDTAEPDLPDMAEFLANTAEPQGNGSDPAAEASQAGGPEATAADSTASAGDAVPTEPTAQPAPAAPEPKAQQPAPKQRGKAKAKAD
jgi:hypothetical protein